MKRMLIAATTIAAVALNSPASAMHYQRTAGMTGHPWSGAHSLAADSPCFLVGSDGAVLKVAGCTASRWWVTPIPTDYTGDGATYALSTWGVLRSPFSGSSAICTALYTWVRTGGTGDTFSVPFGSSPDSCQNSVGTAQVGTIALAEGNGYAYQFTTFNQDATALVSVDYEFARFLP